MRPSRASGARFATPDFPIAREAAGEVVMSDAVDVQVSDPLADVRLRLPSLLQLIREDIGCVRLRDPAARSELETLLTYPGRPCPDLASYRPSSVGGRLEVSGAAVVVVRPLSDQCRHSSRRDDRPTVLYRPRRRRRHRRDRRGRRRRHAVSRRDAGRHVVVAGQAPSHAWRIAWSSAPARRFSGPSPSAGERGSAPIRS